MVINYEHRSNVVTLPTPHARANAAQAARLLEDDRSGYRRELRADLMRQRREHEHEIARIDAALVELNGG